ncbi:hypothetical protein H2200_010100 [Cladophialophora chaetospira]|uniref:Uncharacterized protein n=1 Tax=Cladophialophora chaetospira TaxID=386627 RepID=A0AA38X2C1_9EURO|nr:hypothetical protein H2200_010100 [Cladophialophora chaetospira]
MSDSNQNQISLEDNSDRPMSENENKETPQEGQQQEEAPQKEKGEGGGWITKPEEKGNAFGSKIQGALSPVGNNVGPILEKGAGPIGGLVDPLVGGVMKSGKGWGDTIGVGFGNAEGGPAKQQEAEHQRMKEDFGGKEQTGDNPLGL